jgi:hypothetical protein
MRRGDIDVFTTQSAYVAGDSVQIVIRNVGLNSVRYRVCPTYLDQRTANSWLSVGTYADGFAQPGCDIGLSWLNPGNEAQFARKLPTGLSAGEYRIRFDAFQPLDDVTFLRPGNSISNSFDVGR